MISKPADLIFNYPCTAKLELEDAIFHIYGNVIFYLVIKKNKKATMEIVESGYDFLNSFGGGKFYNIYQFESFSDVDLDVRAWAAKDSGNKYTVADAIVISSFAQKILADFYLKSNKPEKPTRIFSNVESAVQWIEELIAKSNS